MKRLKNWDNKTWLSSKRYINSFNNFLKSKIKFKKNTQILDIGCGRANIISALQKKYKLNAKAIGIDADVFGPMAFDNSVSENAAEIKGIKNLVAGKADILLVPNVEAGNSLVKMMIYFMGACAAGVVVGGKVPVVITSRADSAPARLASIAAAIVTL